MTAPNEPAPVEGELDLLRDDPELAAMFIAEALDHLSSIETLVLELEAHENDQRLLNDVFRPFHTIKGNAGALGIMTVQELAHQVENLLDQCRSGQRAFRSAEADVVLQAVDLLTSQMQDIRQRLAGNGGVNLEAQRQTLLAAVGAVLSSSPAPPEAMVVSTPPASVDVDAFSFAATTDTVPEPAAPSVPEAVPAPAPAPAVAAVHQPDAVAAAATVKVDTRKLDGLIDMVGELVIVQSILQEDSALSTLAGGQLTRHLAQLRRITSDLQRTAMSLRMVPIRQTFQKMSRLVRDLSKKSGKTIDLVLTGEDTELDRRVVEDINDPLMHMVRNSIDHGIEPGEVRASAGKRPEGRLELSAYHQGGDIVIAIKDDGAGLNADRILAKARKQGLVGPSESLEPAEVHQLIFRPGFSTAEQITEISGRGVGMDVVRRNIEALRGRVEIQTTPGAGTTFLIKLPLTLAILDGLILRVGGERFVMPIFAVRESLRPQPDQVHTVHGRPEMVQVRGKLIRLVRLADLFGIPGATENPAEATVVVIDADGQLIGLVVDDLLGRQEVVIKSLGEMFQHVRGIAGSVILGDGRVGLILDAHGLVDPHASPVGRVA